MRRLLTTLLAAWAIAGCTGTFTPPLPTLYLVFQDAGDGEPARVALLDFVVSATDRRLDLLTADAYRFGAGESLIAIDVMDRSERQEVWVLTAAGPGSRAVRVHRLDLRSLPDVPGTTLTRIGAPLVLTDEDGAWVGFGSDTAVPTGCISGLVVAPAGDALALWDAGSGGRCGAGVGDPRVHLLDLANETAGVPINEARAPGVRGGDVDLGRANRLLLVRRPAVGDPDELRVAAVGFQDPVPPPLGAGVGIVGLLDVAGVPGGFAALRRVDGGSARVVELHTFTGEAPVTREMPANASDLYVDESGALGTLLTAGANRIGVTYPDEAKAREVSFDARDLTIDPLNAYALAVRPGGVCVIDLLVPSTAASCDLTVDTAVRAALPHARFVTWTFAEPAAP